MSNYNNYQQQGNYPSQGYPPQSQGEANSYYGGGQTQGSQAYGNQGPGYQHPQTGNSSYNQAPPEYQQYPSAAAHSSSSGRNSHNQGYQNQYGGEGDPEGDRGIMGGLAGGAAGAFGGHALGGKAGHSTSGTIIGAIAGAITGHKAQDKVSDWKDERDEKKKWEKQQHEQQQQHHDQRPPHGGHIYGSGGRPEEQRTRGDYGGNFSSSSRDIRLDAHGDFNLHAQCRRPDGSFQSSSISLNRIIENDNGSFRWSGGQSNGSSTYTVQQGDTLRSIASRFAHCTYEEIARHNNISNPDLIYPGQNLQLPGGGSRGGGNFASSARNIRLADGGQKMEGELMRDGQWHHRSIILDERIGNRNGCLEFV